MADTLNLALSAIVNIGLKFLIQRPRPEGYRLIEQSGFSFPRSGHSMSSMAFYGFIIYLIYKRVEDKEKKNSHSLFQLYSIILSESKV